MPLTHVIASSVCVLAALVMVGSARGRASRAAHVVVAATMSVLALAMGSLAVVVAGVAVLAVTGVLLRRRHREPEARSCAVDVVGCAALVGLMGVGLVLVPVAHGSSMPGMTGTHHASATSPRPFLLLVALVLLAGWALARRRTPDTDAGRAGVVASWLMMLAMTAMVAG